MGTQTVTNAEIVAIVKRHVERRQEPGRRLKVLDDAVMHVREGVPETGDRWYVVVRPEDPEQSGSVWFVDVTSEIEDEIEQEDGLTVYLQSILPHY